MRPSTAGWFAAGCGLAVIALVVVAGGSVAVNAARSDVNHDAQGIADGTLDAWTPAVDPGSSEDVAAITPHATPQWLNVTVQRPRALRESSTIAPPPPNLEEDDSLAAVGGARLPNPEATMHWDPDDARMPAYTTVVARADWNPDSATLPRAPKRPRRATWNPNDARLPSS